MNEDANATDYESGQSIFWLFMIRFCDQLVSRDALLLLSLSLLLWVLLLMFAVTGTDKCCASGTFDIPFFSVQFL